MNGSIPLMEEDIDITEKEEDRGKDQLTLSKKNGQPCSSEEIAELIDKLTSFSLRSAADIKDTLERLNPVLRTATLNEIKILKSWIESLPDNKRLSVSPTIHDLSIAYDAVAHALTVLHKDPWLKSFPSDFWNAIETEFMTLSNSFLKYIEKPDKFNFERENYQNGSKPVPVSQVTVPAKFKDGNSIVYDFKEKTYRQHDAIVTDHSQLTSGPIHIINRINNSHDVPAEGVDVEFVDTSHYRVSHPHLLRQTNFTNHYIKFSGCSFICYLNSAILGGMPAPTTKETEVEKIFEMCKHFGYITGRATTQCPGYIGPMAALFLDLKGENGNHFTTLQNCPVERIRYSASTLLYPNCKIDDSTHYTTLLNGGLEWDPYECKKVNDTALGMPDPTFLSQRRIAGNDRRSPIGLPDRTNNFIPLPAGTVEKVITYMKDKGITMRESVALKKRGSSSCMRKESPLFRL